MKFRKTVVLALSVAMVCLASGCGNSKTGNPEATDSNGPATNVKAGDTFTFGEYEQDNDVSNGKEPIEWTLLDIVDGKALLISNYSLDCVPYNESLTGVTWETCSLREWLNGTFLNAAFSSDEQTRIVSASVKPDRNPFPEFDAPIGNETTDKVFVLSISEAEKYLKTADQLKCAPTDYAISQGSWVSGTEKKDGRALGQWWLRTPGSSADHVTLASYSGNIYYDGYEVSKDMVSVRPAIWIYLES